MILNKLYAILCVMQIAMHQVALFMSNPEPAPHFCQLLATTFVLRLVVLNFPELTIQDNILDVINNFFWM